MILWSCFTSKFLNFLRFSLSFPSLLSWMTCLLKVDPKPSQKSQGPSRSAATSRSDTRCGTNFMDHKVYAKKKGKRRKHEVWETFTWIFWMVMNTNFTNAIRIISFTLWRLLCSDLASVSFPVKSFSLPSVVFLSRLNASSCAANAWSPTVRPAERDASEMDVLWFPDFLKVIISDDVCEHACWENHIFP